MWYAVVALLANLVTLVSFVAITRMLRRAEARLELLEPFDMLARTYRDWAWREELKTTKDRYVECIHCKQVVPMDESLFFDPHLSLHAEGKQFLGFCLTCGQMPIHWMGTPGRSSPFCWDCPVCCPHGNEHAERRQDMRRYLRVRDRGRTAVAQ